MVDPRPLPLIREVINRTLRFRLVLSEGDGALAALCTLHSQSQLFSQMAADGRTGKEGNGRDTYSAVAASSEDGK